MVAKEIELEDRFENIGAQMVMEVASKTSDEVGDGTTIIDGRCDHKDLEKRIRQIKIQIEETTSNYNKDKLQERLAKLAGGIAVVHVVGDIVQTAHRQNKSVGLCGEMAGDPASALLLLGLGAIR